MTSPTDGLIPATPRKNGDTLSMLTIGLIVFGGWVAYEVFMAGASILETIRVTQLPQRLGLPPEQVGQATLACWDDAPCKAWLEGRFWTLFPKWHLGFLALIPVPALLVAFRKDKPKYDQKAPGNARWAEMKDVAHLAPEADQVDKGNPHTGYLGNLLQFKPRQQHAEVYPLLVPLNEWCQNILVQGGVGSGKTTGFFQNYGMMAAHLGHTILVVDTKWPQRDSGLRELIGYWHAMGRNVVLYAPFEKDSIQLDMTGELSSFDQALRYADTVMPPPEFKDEAGQHFKQVERRVLAAMAMVNAKGGGTQPELLKTAMQPLGKLKTWADKVEDKLLKSVLDGALSRGDKDFADSMTGIISALRVFFNDNVARATSPGRPETTADLEACFRKPTLIYAAFNQEDMLDGSGTILLRMLLRNVTEAIFRVSATTPTGKLPHPATILMDEQPSYGRMNYLMRLTGTMRSYNLSILFGIQDSAQGKLVYGEDYWTAISENVISRRIVFPRGLTGKDAEDISRRIGFTTNLGVSVGVTGGQDGGQDRYSATTRLEKQPLLAPEQFNTFGIGEGIVLSSQHPPIRALFTPITFSEIKSDHVKPGTPNWLHEMFYKDMLARIPKGMTLSAYTDQLIAQGTFTTLPRGLQSHPQEIAPGVARPLGHEESRARFREWVALALNLEVDVRYFPGSTRDPGYQFPKDAVTQYPEVANLTAFLQDAGFLKLLDTKAAYKVLQAGWDVLTYDLRERVMLARYTTPVTAYIRKNGELIDGHPQRDATPEEEREEAVGDLHEDKFRVRLKNLSAIYLNQPQPPFPRQRVGSVDMAVIPYKDAMEMKRLIEEGQVTHAAQAGDAPPPVDAGGGSGSPFKRGGA